MLSEILNSPEIVNFSQVYNNAYKSYANVQLSGPGTGSN